MKTFAEFFAGIGLIRAGLTPSGWHCAYANDIELKKQQMYVDQFGEAPEYQLADIWDAASVLPRLPDDVVMATASFPCTDLSLAGHWRGIDGKHSSTFFAFVNLLEQLGSRRPPILLIENVIGFINSNGGADFARACRELSLHGYWLDAVVVDAKWFVPQSRPRVFLIGVQQGLRRHELFEPTTQLLHLFPELVNDDASDLLRPPQLRRTIATTKLKTGWIKARLPVPPRRTVELCDLLDVGDDEAWWAEDDVTRHLDLMQEPSIRRIRHLIDAPAYTVGTAFRRTRLGKPRTETRFDIAGCLRTPRGGSARQIVIRVGRGQVRLRWMSPREYARLQGVGNFNIRVPAQQALFGFGDAVCVPAITWIDQHLLTPLALAAIGPCEPSNCGHILAS